MAHLIQWYSSYSFNKNLSNYNAGLGSALENFGFVWHNADASYVPKRGDISVQHKTYVEGGTAKKAHHVEVVENFDANTQVCHIWSWGTVHSSLPVSRRNWRERTSGYWRLEQ